MYTNFEKEKLGKTFQYYRNKMNVKWQEISKKSKMSKTYYSKLSNGIIFDNNSIYDEFLDFFNLTFTKKDDFEIWLNQYLLNLIPALEQFDQSLIKKMNIEYQEELKEYKDSPIYNQYYQIFEHIFRYYHDNKYLNVQEIKEDILLIENGFAEEELVVFLLEVMYISNNNSIGNIKLRDQIINVIDKIDDKVLIYIKAIDEKCKGRLNSALDYFEKSCVCWKNVSLYREVKSINGKFMIYSNIDDLKAINTICQLKNEVNSDNLPNSFKNSVNYNIGIYYFMKKKYEESYNCFYENIIKYDGIKEMIFIGSICTHLQKELPECFTSIDYSNSNYKQYIDYYKMKKEGKTDTDLVDYIINVLMYEKLVHNEYAEPMWRIYEYELFEFMKKSKKHTKYYIKYKEMLDKICKYV